ncbi:MAG: crotonyl-CoA carboxylase/reductase [Chloroflexi bacterium]|nr:crotonyl-CoA carboxylase/reductase [Chloroflexota bacterium]
MGARAFKEIYDIGEMPPTGHVPRYMHAQVIRRSRYGEPRQAFQVERMEVPSLGPDEVLLYVMAAGINYNNVWAAAGQPLDVIQARQRAGEPHDFHIGGSDASGIVYAVGSDVTSVKVGDHVVVNDNWWDRNDPFVKAGGDPMYSPSFRIWGYETNWGSFAQFAKVQAHQCHPKPPQLTWEEAGGYMLVGTTAYRMLAGWPEHTVRPGDVVLVWGGSGGLGSLALQIAREMGGIPIAVVSSDERGAYCVKLGAKGYVNRKGFDHWGPMPPSGNVEAYGKWLAGVRKFGRAIWDVLGERKSPRIVFEHPGQDTIPTSVFVCDAGGMVVICGATSGFDATLDLRYHWVRQKRLQGSHSATDQEAAALNRLVAEGKVSPCLSRVFNFQEISLAHQLMHQNHHPPGNMVALVGAPRTGLKGVA